MSKNFAYTLFFLLACLSSNYSANGHAGVGVVVKDGCDRYLAIGTWHSSISELNSTINSNRGLYIDINNDGTFVNCCNGTSSSEFFIFTDYTIPSTPVSWSFITPGSSTITELVNYFNNSTVYNSANLANRFTAEKVWDPGCLGNKKLQSWIILKLPSSLNPGTTYNCRTSTSSVVETPCNIPYIFQITFGSDITITGDDTLMCESDSLILTSSPAPDLEWFRNGVLIQGPNDDNTIAVLQPGNYTVRKGGIGCQSRTSEIYEVAFHPQPKAQFTIDDSLQCFRDHEIVVVNESTVVQGTVQSITWTTDSTDYPNVDTLNQVYSSANDYTIQLTIESDQGCFDSLTKAITIYPMPVAQFALDTTHLCERGNVFAIDYQGLISDGSIYKRWSFGDGDSSTTADDTTKSYTTFGSYTIRLELMSDFDCRDTIEQILTVHPQPKAQFTIDDSLQCFRDHEIVAVNESTLVQGTVQSITWTTDSKDYLDIDTLNQVYSSANDYTIQLTIESDQGCFDSLTKAVTIYPMPEAQFALDTTHLCERGNVFAIEYQGLISDGSIYKRWSFGDGDSSTTADDTTKSYTTFGSYTIRLELMSDFDCRDTIEQILTVHPQPKAQFTIDDSLQCFRGHEIVAVNESTVVQGTVQSLTWTTDSTDYPNIDTLNQVYSSANDHTIQLTIESDQGCFDSLTKAVTIYPMPEAQFALDTTHLCESGNVFAIDYQGLISDGSIYKRWSFGDGDSSTTADDTTKSYTTFGSYTIRLELVSDFDCRDTIEQILTVHPQPKAQFTIDDSLQCFSNHEIVAVNKSTVVKGTVQSLTWTTDSKDYLDIDTLNQVYSSANDYTIQLTIESDQGCFDSLTKAITIYPRPEAAFLLDTSEQSCFEFPFINTSIGDKIQPYWTIKNADTSSTSYFEDNPKHTLDKLVDSVFACLKVSDKNGCLDSVCLSFPNKFKESLHLYNIFTPDNDGYNDTYLVDIVGASEFQLYIYNRWGNQLFFSQDPKNGWNGQFENSGDTLPEGTYFYIVKYRMLCTEKQERISGIVELIR